MTRRRAFTLIECLIVVAILSIIGGGFFSVMGLTIQSEAEETRIGALREDGLSVVRALLRDTYAARQARVVVVQGTGTEVSQPPSNSELQLDMAAAESDATRRITYRLAGPRLERVISDEKGTSPTVQVLAENVRRWTLERSGGLIKAEIGLGISRYAKEFKREYRVTLRAGRAAHAPEEVSR